jgi:hypothetical protein
MRAGLDARLRKLEVAVRGRGGANACRACGLRHVRPMTMALLRGVLRVAGGTDGDVAGEPLCLCACCTSDPRDGWFARQSHGMAVDAA